MPENLSLEKAVGRLLVGRLPGKTLDAQFKHLLESGTAGGICIFKDNVEDLKQLINLVAEIGKASTFNPIICVDQEGGAVQRFDDVLTPLPSLMALAATGNEKHVETAAVINGRQLRTLGVNCVLSPVVDVASNPLNPIIGTRAFSSDVETVTKYARAMLEAFMQEGVVPVVKHYPGHGDTGQDSHSELAVIDRPQKSVEDLELVPFKNCAQLAPALLAGHVWLTAYEEKALPATLSKKLMQDVLRKDLGFDGLIFTDDMMMKAVSGHYGLAESALLAIEAGCDVVLLCCSADQLEEAHQFIVDAVKNGRLEKERIYEACRRVNQLFPESAKLNSDPESRFSQISSWLADDLARIFAIYRDSICLLKGDMPAVDERLLTVVYPKHPRYPLPLVQYLKERLVLAGIKPSIEEVTYSVNPDREEIKSIVAKTEGKNVALVTFRAGLNEGQKVLAEHLEKFASNFFGVAADSPYDLDAVSEDASYLCTFDPSNMAMEQLAIMLVHGENAKGTCPVALDAKSKQNEIKA